MFEYLERKSNEYLIRDTVSKKTDSVSLDVIKTALQMGVEINGISIKNGKLRLISREERLNKISLLSNLEVIVKDNEVHVIGIKNDNSNGKYFFPDDIAYCDIELLEDENSCISVSGGRGLLRLCTSDNVDWGSSFFQYAHNCIDVSNLDLLSARNLGGMFQNCNVKNIKLSGIKTYDVKMADFMFYRCRTNELDLNNFNLKNCESAKYMFWASAVDNIKGLDTVRGDVKGFFRDVPREEVESYDAPKYLMEA